MRSFNHLTSLSRTKSPCKCRLPPQVDSGSQSLDMVPTLTSLFSWPYVSPYRRCPRGWSLAWTCLSHHIPCFFPAKTHSIKLGTYFEPLVSVLGPSSLHSGRSVEFLIITEIESVPTICLHWCSHERCYLWIPTCSFRLRFVFNYWAWSYSTILY